MSAPLLTFRTFVLSGSLSLSDSVYHATNNPLYILKLGYKLLNFSEDFPLTVIRLVRQPQWCSQLKAPADNIKPV